MPDPDTIARDTFRRILDARYQAWLAMGADIASWGQSEAFANAVAEADAAAIRTLPPSSLVGPGMPKRPEPDQRRDP